MYFVGRIRAKIGAGWRETGSKWPEAADMNPAVLRGKLNRREITCDFKDGEKQPEEMAFVGGSSVVTRESQVATVEAKTKRAVPHDATRGDLASVYNHLTSGQPIKGERPGWFQQRDDDSGKKSKK